MAKAKQEEQSVSIPQMRTQRVVFSVVGITPLITHAWSEKAKKEMRDKQQKAAKAPKAIRDPQADFEGAKYKDAKGRDCVPSLAFKNAIVSAARLTDGLAMTTLRTTVFIEGELLPIEYEDCQMREDMVRVGGKAGPGSGSADLRYRPAYHGWKVKLPVSFNANIVSIDQIANLVKLAGFSVGICEWRPEKRGDFGRFDIEDRISA